MALGRPVRAFSGGARQKIVIDKGLYRDSDIYIFARPTLGVDIGARAKLHTLTRALSKHAGVIMMSSDCDEVAWPRRPGDGALQGPARQSRWPGAGTLVGILLRGVLRSGSALLG